MSATNELQSDALDRLISELGISREPIATLLDQSRKDLNTAKRMGDDEQARILQKTQRWLDILDKQNKASEEMAEALFNACCRSLEGPREKILEGLKWTLVGFEHRIEAEQPIDVDSSSRFHVRWDAINGVGFWRTDQCETSPVSVLEIVRDAAETDGGFSRTASDLIATSIIGELRTGQLQLMRLRIRRDESSLEETVFELLPRGAHSAVGLNEGDPATTVAFSGAEDEICLATELEARLGAEAPGLAAMLDEAACETAEVDYHFCLATPAGSDWAAENSRRIEVGRQSHGRAVLRRRINEVAEQYKQSPTVITNCFVAIASYKLHSCQLAGDLEGAFVYGNTLKSLAPIILSEVR